MLEGNVKISVSRKELWQGIGKVKQKDWKKAAMRLNLNVSVSGGKGSHIVIRDPNCQNQNDIDSLIATVQKNLAKQLNQTIFKHLLEYGISEDDIWKALKMLK